MGQLTADGLEALPTLFPMLLNAAMQIERQKPLGAAPHERTQKRTGHVNSYKDKTLNTPLGQFTVAVPQVLEVNGQGDGICLSSSAYVFWDLDPALKGRATRRKPLYHPATERSDYGRG